MSDVTLLIAILKDYRLVEEILLGFIENDVTGATVLEGRGMGQILGQVPIFADLRGNFPGSMHDSSVIMAAMPSSKIQSCIDIIEDVCDPLDQPASGITFTLPIDRILGLKSSLP
ncbi:MAG: hypothetical protein VX589_14605 [Myxococcota bacterium]|nr:hypothetical protein [Myxococcota bacterium]